MACGTPDLFPPFFQSFTDCCLLVIFESQPSQIDLNNFEQYVVGSHTKICKQVNCSTHIIFFDSLIHSKVTKIFTSTSFRSQQIDCLFTAFKFYFTEIVDLKGSIFQKLLAAVHFHQSLPYPSLKQPSLARKRLLFSAHISYGKGKYLNQTGFFFTKFAKILFIFKFKGVTHRIQPT